VHSSFLEDSTLPPSRSQILSQRFAAARDALRARLAQTGFALPRVADVSWRLDYFMKSNVLEQVDEAVYTVKLHGTRTHASCANG
jgi:hypothetical protein